MNLVICPESRVHKEIKKVELSGHKAYLVSIRDVGKRGPFPTARVLRTPTIAINFDDVLNTNYGYTPPNRQQIKNILDWVADQEIHNNDTLIVHCYAGMSRSPAAAIAIMAQHTGSARAACRIVKEVHPNAYPNELVILHADNLLGMAGYLIGETNEHFPHNRIVKRIIH